MKSWEEKYIETVKRIWIVRGGNATFSRAVSSREERFASSVFVRIYILYFLQRLNDGLDKLRVSGACTQLSQRRRRFLWESFRSPLKMQPGVMLMTKEIGHERRSLRKQGTSRESRLMYIISSIISISLVHSIEEFSYRRL